MYAFGGLLTVLAIGVVGTLHATPAPPCGGAPQPSYSAAFGAPALQSQTVADWRPLACLGWTGAAPTLLVALAGQLREPGGAAALLARFGQVSGLRGALYWSVTDKAWQTLVTDAYATRDAGGRARRDDFRPEEMLPGQPLYSAERDNRAAGAVIYRMLVLSRSPDRVVIQMVNVTAVHAYFLTLFAPGELQTTYFLDRLRGDEWGFYGLWGIATGLLTGGHADSSINRAMTLYRHYAGIPTDREPPAAR